MIAATTHFKLGLFALVTLAALVVAVLVLGLRKRPRELYYTYFDESVQGLELGAQVKYRGVWIGSVEAIAIAPDRRHVEVELAVDRERVRSFALADLVPRLRAELVMVGITGLKVVEIDVAEPDEAAAPRLMFLPARPYIPARRSLLKGVEDALQTTGDQLKLLVDRTVGTLQKVELVIDEARREDIPRRVANIVDTAGDAVADLRRGMRKVERAEVAEKLATAVDRFDRAAAQLNQILARVDGDDGLVASARRATESVADLGRGTLESTGELDGTLGELRDAARAVRAFMEQLEREPEMLLKGRARTDRP
jgi:ABC-type transporter Mla subunit MlaD